MLKLKSRDLKVSYTAVGILLFVSLGHAAVPFRMNTNALAGMGSYTGSTALFSNCCVDLFSIICFFCYCNDILHADTVLPEKHEVVIPHVVLSDGQNVSQYCNDTLLLQSLRFSVFANLCIFSFKLFCQLHPTILH